MTKPGNDQDRVQREIEELLGKLDNFVPEQRFTEKIRERARRRDASSPGLLTRFRKRVSRVSLGQMLLAGFVLIVLAYFFRGPLGGASNWLIGLGLVMAAIAFVLSITRGGTSASVGGTVEKRWRGQVIEYSPGSTPADRIRGWFRNRRRR